VREICCDVETTGLEVSEGHRIVEIGCVELVNRRPTGKTFHAYLNPYREVDKDAVAIHGLSNDFLRDKPSFDDYAVELIIFLGDANLVAHNARFDMGFLNMELEKAGFTKLLAPERWVDTLLIAALKHPGNNTLDGLCKRYRIDTAKRTKHGALLDAELLAQVYIELVEERQSSLGFAGSAALDISAEYVKMPQRQTPLLPRVNAEERLAHRKFLATFKARPIWYDYLDPPPEEQTG
jgi:DNA polymerase III subunit epsilon